MSSDAIFAFVAFVAVGCFAALITLQVMEWQFYEAPPNIWPAAPVIQQAAPAQQ